jgi:hypothetical protein
VLGASYADFDNDGWLDIYAADGWVKNDPGTELELEFLNNVVSHQDIDKPSSISFMGFFGGKLVARMGTEPSPAQ